MNDPAEEACRLHLYIHRVSVRIDREACLYIRKRRNVYATEHHIVRDVNRVL